MLRRRLEAEHGSDGLKEYIGVLRLLEKQSLARLEQVVTKALEFGCPRKALIAQYLYGENQKVVAFPLDGYEQLKVINVSCTNPGDYTSLLADKKEVRL